MNQEQLDKLNIITVRWFSLLSDMTMTDNRNNSRPPNNDITAFLTQQYLTEEEKIFVSSRDKTLIKDTSSFLLDISKSDIGNSNSFLTWLSHAVQSKVYITRKRKSDAASSSNNNKKHKAKAVTTFDNDKSSEGVFAIPSASIDLDSSSFSSSSSSSSSASSSNSPKHSVPASKASASQLLDALLEDSSDEDGDESSEFSLFINKIKDKTDEDIIKFFEDNFPERRSPQRLNEFWGVCGESLSVLFLKILCQIRSFVLTAILMRESSLVIGLKIMTRLL
jgi:hypothetical protein